MSKLFAEEESKRAIQRFASSADGSVIARVLLKERKVIVYTLGLVPVSSNADWLRGRLGLLLELLDEMGKSDGG